MIEFLKAHCSKYQVGSHHCSSLDDSGNRPSQYTTVNSEEWKEFFLDYFSGKVEAEVSGACELRLFLIRFHFGASSRLI